MSVLIDALEARRLFATTWSTYAKLIGQDAAAANFASLTGKGQTVAVIDTGVDYTHKSLGGGFGAKFKVIAGYDFVDNDPDPRDDTLTGGHGTEVAGMIAANRFTQKDADGKDITYQGIAPDAKIVALRAGTNDAGFSDQALQQAMNWVIANRAKYGITVVNLSLGSESFKLERVQRQFADEFKTLADAGVAVVGAAGNSGDVFGDTVESPSADPNVFSIGSVTADGDISYFSERGRELDLFAPGEQVVSTMVGNKYGPVDGTSFSSPLVAGVFALLGQATSTLSKDDMMSVLRSSSTTQYDDADDYAAGSGAAGITTHRAYAQLDLPAALALAQGTEKNNAIDEFAAGKGTDFDVAYDRQGVLHLAYYDASSGRLLYRRRLSNGNWTSATVIDKNGAGRNLSIAIDPTGKAGVAYYDGTKQDLKYARFDGSKFVVQTLDDKGNVGQSPSLAFNAEGEASISYYRETSNDLRLVSYDYEKGAWTRKTIDSAGDVGRTSSIAYYREGQTLTDQFGIEQIEYYDTLGIAYADSTNGNLKYWASGTDSATDVVTTSAPRTIDDLDGVGSISLVLLDSGNGAVSQRIAYQDSADADVKYAYRTSKGWKTFDVATTGAVGSTIDSYVDGNGEHHIVFYDKSKKASYDAMINSSFRRSSLTRISAAGATAAAASDRRGGNAVLIGLARSGDSFGVTDIV